MDLIEELKNYCDINNPVGALMLSGEWGCGKTYLIKNKFIPLMRDRYVFVCVSLFGIDSLDNLRVEVKKKWLGKASEVEKMFQRLQILIKKYLVQSRIFCLKICKKKEK